MKKNLAIILLVFLSINLYAERVDKNTAMKVAKTMVNDVDLNNISTRSYNNLYIFSGDNGFVIVSADDRVTPIIGYSNNNAFVLNNDMTNVAYWLDKANDEIQYAIDNDIEATDEIKREWKTLAQGIRPDVRNRSVVEALLTTEWNQDAPYNEMCPGGSMTGCGATAMAQVMKYWNWPKVGVGQKTYNENDYGQISVNFAATLYDWDNMLDSPTKYSPEVNRKAVATLMYHCGVAMEMDYGLDGSGAYPTEISPAMITYFGYKSSTIKDVVFQYYMSNAYWANILKEELDESRPMVYNGWDTEGMGHSFVCDGYDEYDNFHFNWGWGGYCDGYFAIGALSPGIGGIGSGSGHYNERNYIVKGIEPDYSIGNPLNLVTYSNGYEPIINLAWSSVYEDATYNIYRTHNNNTTQIASNLTEKTYVDTNLEYDNEYCYVVKSVVNGAENDESDESCFTLISNSCTPPSNITYNIVEDDPNYNMKFKVTISWEEVASANSYMVYVNGSKYKKLTENSFELGTNKEMTMEVNIQSICNDGYESDLSETVTIKVEHIGINEYENTFEIFPNPVNDKLYIKGEAAIEEINIFNITGVKVYNEVCLMKNNEYMVNVNNLPEGIYVVNVTTTEGNVIRRFIKN